MNSSDSRNFPQKSDADFLHGVVRGAISLAPAGGAWSELFTFLIKPPFERRMEEWMREIEMRLRHLAARDRQLFEALPCNDVFASVLLAATQAAARTHQKEKLLLLAAAVETSASNFDVGADRQLLFVRFVDELTVSHFALLSFLATHTSAAAHIEAYSDLLAMFLEATDCSCSEDEFTLFCNDLSSRVLVRFSNDIEEFGGTSHKILRATEMVRVGVRVLVTPLGHSLLTFVGQASAQASI